MRLKNINAIIKKELTRFITDKRLLFVSVFMPGIMIFLMYSLLGAYINGSEKKEETSYHVAVNHLPESLVTLKSLKNVEIESMGEAGQLKEYQSQVRSEILDAAVVFSDTFDSSMKAIKEGRPTKAEEISIYYNSGNDKSKAAYAYLQSYFNSYESSLFNALDINAGGGQYDLASDEKGIAKTLSGLLPMLIMTILFSVCMSLAPDSIAGEKERGTITTLLVTPVKRSDLAIGKILSLGILAMASGLFSCLAIILSMPKIFGSDQVKASMYGGKDYFFLLLVVLSTILVMIAITCLISANARSIREASTSIAPLTFAVIMIGFSGMFIPYTETTTAMYVIPLFNSVQCLTAIFAKDFRAVNCVVATISNIVCVILMTMGLAKMFNSERVMFNR
mgnify:FL=1|nr:ABC transporter permease [uncultured Shuttleworthia sp.]